MIYFVAKDTRKKQCFFEVAENFDVLVDLLELTPFYYEIFATMKEKEANAKLEEWRVKFHDCNS